MPETKRVSLLIVILALVVAAAGGTGAALLYNTAVTEQRARLCEMAQSLVRLIDAVAEHESATAGMPQQAEAAVLAQVQASYERFDTEGQTTEIVLARPQGGRMVFLLRRRKHQTEAPSSLPTETPLAIPLQHALAGESGTTIDVDYRGQTVLAAYEPVKTLGWGVVVKRDMSEIRAPFWRAGLFAGLCAVVAIALGAWAFVAVTSPLLQHLRDSEDRLRRAITYAPFPMMLHAEDGRILLTSNAWNRLSGYTPQQIATIRDWIGRAYGQQADFHLQRIAHLYGTDGPVAEGEREVHTAGGGTRTWDFSSAPLGRSDDGVRLAISMAMDITDRKAAERELAIEKEQLRVTLQSIGDGVITTDVYGAVATMNPVAEALTGWPAQEAQGKPLAQVFHIINQSTRQVCENPAEKVLQSGRVVGLANHTALIHRDGSERVIADSGAPIIDAGGKVTGVVLVFRDNTEMDQAHNALAKAKEEAEAASRAKDRFLAALSHELRTPLTPVLMMVSMLQGDPRASAVSEDLAMIRRSIELESRLIDDLLDLTRIVRGKLKMDWQIVNAEEVLRQALEVARGGTEPHSIEIRYEPPDQPCIVRADPARLEQVFWNIIRNAMQYTPDGGNLTIRAACLDGVCVVSFTDTGVGIEREFLPRIFDAFERGDAAALRRPGGLGLGLAICRSIMQHMDGSIEARSKGRNQGSTFTVRLPLTAAQPVLPAPLAPLAPSPAEAPAHAGGLRVLLVEDHAMTLKILARLLTGKGHEVAAAPTVQAALDLAASRCFDLLVSDIGLPDGSGMDVMRWFTQHRPIRGIALSGFGMDADIERSLQAGFTTHLVKPVNPELLLQTISRVASGIAGSKQT